MKKLFALVLALIMCLSLFACGTDDKDDKDDKKNKADSEIEEYMEDHGDELIDAMEEAFAKSSGMTCKSSYEVKGNELILEICINELEDVDDDIKKQMQDAYDGMQYVWDASLEEMQRELDELEKLTVRVCEKDGTLLAEVSAGK